MSCKSLCNFGSHVICGHNVVYMILEENSQHNSKPYYRTVTSEMSAQQRKFFYLTPCGKRMHQTVVNVLKTLLHGEPPQDMASAKGNVNEALSTAMHAINAAIHSTLGSSPRSLTFNRDMFLNWQTITQR